MIIMAEKKTGTLDKELLIHPGETISDILEEQGISQATLAAKAGVSRPFLNSVIKGKKGISPKLAAGLEYALGVPKSFWLNLQANYEVEKLEAEQLSTVTEKEINILSRLDDMVVQLRNDKKIPAKEDEVHTVISLRRALQFSNLCNLAKLTPDFIANLPANIKENHYIVQAWHYLNGDNALAN